MMELFYKEVANLGKEEDLRYIKSFSKINVKSVCEELGIDRQNVLNNKASAINTAKVRKAIEQKLKELEEGNSKDLK